MGRVLKFFAAVVVAAAVVLPTGARAATILFTGATGPGGAAQGVIGHDFVSRTSIAHMNAFYASVGSAGPYTALATPDSYDFATGGDLPVGSNVPARQFGATAPASAALASVGILGSLHLGIRGFTLDYNNVSDLFQSGPTSERRIYRNGEAAIFEEVAPGVFNEVAAYTGGVFTIDIDYSDLSIVNQFSGTLSPGSMSIFPETWTGTSFDPIDLAGTTPEIYGGFSITTSIEIAASVPAPGGAAILAAFAAGAAIRRRALR